MRKNFLACLACAVVMVCFCVGCSSKTPITTQVFTQTMEAEKFTVTDVTEQTETNDLATAVIVAVAEGEKYQVEFWELTDNETGEGVFYNNKKLFNDEHSIKTMANEVALNNYDYYSFTADGNFHMIARIDNTMLYCEAEKTYKEDIIDLVEKLGYK